MALGLLADHNVELHVEAILAACRNPPWDELWAELAISRYAFPDLNLQIDSTDVDVWHRCQERSVLLVTANRNHRGIDSLEAVIRRDGTVYSLPVLTLAD